MSKLASGSFMVLCAALAACSNGDTNGAVTAPDVAPSFNEAAADISGSSAYDGPFDFVAGSGVSSTQMAASVQAASGGRASGHVRLTLGTGFFTNITTEEYNFVALATDPATPFAAKGNYHMTLTTATGVLQEFHGEVICVAVAGNAARVVGQLTSVVVNGIPRAINPAQSHNIWSVTDNGEGSNGTPDQASPMIFFPATFAPLHCPNDFIPPQFNNETGNIQVKQ